MARGARKTPSTGPLPCVPQAPDKPVARGGRAAYIGALRRIGASPSGKAAVFGTAIPRFESWRPSQYHPK